MDWIGCLLALIGSALIASKTSVSKYSFLVYFASNVAWIIYAAVNGINSLLLMQVGFATLNIVGIYRWLILKE